MTGVKGQKTNYFRGFTLIEVSIVIFIMLIMTSAVVPWMKTFAESSKIKGVSRSIVSLIEFARSSAVTQRIEYVILFDSVNREYWLSLKEFLDESSGNIIDSSRTSLSGSLKSLSASEDNSDEEKVSETAYSRTGGILGIPRKLPEGVEIARLLSLEDDNNSRTRNFSNNTFDYVTFYPDGTGENFEIYLQSSAGRIFLINVTASTGRTGIRELREDEIEGLGLFVENIK